MQRHFLSSAFPDMPEKKFAELVDSIKQHGQHDPVVIFEGMVLDGWHRFTACQQLGIDCAAEEYTGADPQEFVLARNLPLREWDAGQRAVITATVRGWRKSGINNENQEKAKGDTPSPLAATNKQMAEEAGVSTRTIQRAKKAIEAGLGADVKSGKLSVGAAAKKTVAEGEKGPEPEEAPAEETVSMTKAKYDNLMGLVEDSHSFSVAMEKIMDGDDTQADAVATIQALTKKNTLLQSQCEGYMNKNNELIKIVKSNKRQIALLEKENAALTAAALPY